MPCVGRIPLLTCTILALSVAAPATASAWMPEPLQFARAVPLGGAHAAGATRTVDVPTARRFDMLGVEWRGARRVDIRLRARLVSGRWTRWASASAGDDGSDRPEHGRRLNFSDPIWVGGANRVQLRLSHAVAGLRLRLINTTGSATAAARRKTHREVKKRGAFGTAKLPAPSAGMPPIVPRADWGASRCKPRVTPGYGTVKVAYVHHTLSLNGYSRSRAASVVLGVCLFHRNSRGWNDIGYDFLIDRYGTVFEGRAGGIDAPVIGAQAGGFNSESTGVSMIGTFTRSAPPRAAMDSLARLLAWKLGLHGVPAIGRTQVTSSGGPDTRFRAGTRVTVNRISGHRDVDATECPGNALYRRLPWLRRQVARLEGPISQLTVSPIVQGSTYGSMVPLSGRLVLPDGANPDGAPIELRRFAKFQDTAVATTTAGPDGSWSALLPPLPGTSAVRAVFTGDPGRPGTVSDTSYVGVDPVVSLTAQSSGLTVIASGTVAPSKRRVTVTAYLGSRSVAKRTLRVRRGSFRGGIRLKKAGSYRLVARVGADDRSASGRSGAIAVQAAPAA